MVSGRASDDDSRTFRKGPLALRVLAGPSFDVWKIERDGLLDPQSLLDQGLPAPPATNRPVVLFGSGPIWLFVYLQALAAEAGWLAVGDPTRGAVVVRSRTPGVEPGQVIPMSDILAVSGIATSLPPTVSAAPIEPDGEGVRVVALVGPPHSGKSVFFLHLWKTLEQVLGSQLLHDHVFFQTTVPDGEGKWVAGLDSQVLGILRRKGPFTMEFARQSGDALRGLRQSKRLVVADLGGRIDEKQSPILRECTHAIIVSRDRTLESEWLGALRLMGVVPLAIVRSSLREESVVVESEPLLVCGLGPLERALGARRPEIPPELLRLVVGGLGAGS